MCYELQPRRHISVFNTNKVWFQDIINDRYDQRLQISIGRHCGDLDALQAKQALFWRMQAMGSLGMHMTMNMGSVSAGNSPVSGLLNANTNMARFNSEGTGIGMNAGMAQRSAQSPMMNSNSAGQLVPSYQTSVSTQVTSSSSSNFLPTMQTRSEPSNRMAGLLFGAVNNMQVGASSASGSFQTGGSGMGMLGDLTWITRGGTNASVANNTAGSTHSLAQRSGGGSFISNSHAASSPMSAAGTSTPMQGRRVGAGDATQQSMPGTALGSPEFSSPNLTCHKCRLMGVYQCMCSGEGPPVDSLISSPDRAHHLQH